MGALFAECAVDRIEAASLDLSGATLRDVEIASSRNGGLQAHDADACGRSCAAVVAPDLAEHLGIDVVSVPDSVRIRAGPPRGPGTVAR